MVVYQANLIIHMTKIHEVLAVNYTLLMLPALRRGICQALSLYNAPSNHDRVSNRNAYANTGVIQFKHSLRHSHRRSSRRR
jgi:hypothetical protein